MLPGCLSMTFKTEKRACRALQVSLSFAACRSCHSGSSESFTSYGHQLCQVPSATTLHDILNVIVRRTDWVPELVTECVMPVGHTQFAYWACGEESKYM